MTRPLRIAVAGGWYHMTARGIERRAIFREEADYRHFLELLGALPERYGVRIHAYVLMGNHYHLLIQTPEANGSQAMQWLNVSYSVWFNRRYDRVGPLFQGRFKSVLVDGEGAWALEASRYIHLNPVRVGGLGLGKRERAGERRGISRAPTEEEVTSRLRVLRGYRWSSYGEYAGYRGKSRWLTTGELLGRVGKEKRKAEGRYRKTMEDMIRQGVEETKWEAWRGRLVVGTREFVERTGAKVRGDRREQPGLRQVERRVSFEEVVKAVEGLKGEKWEGFCNRYGDWGRDVALAAARRCCGLTLRELGAKAGAMNYAGVSEAIRRVERQASRDRAMQVRLETLRKRLLKIET